MDELISLMIVVPDDPESEYLGLFDTLYAMVQTH
jgi:hypothetical protein